MTRTHGPNYPGKGNPCNGCGYCCTMTACYYGQKYAGGKPWDRCPALENDGERFRCGLMVNPEEYVGRDDILTARFFQEAIGAGKGCDSEAPLTDFLSLAFDNSTVIDGELESILDVIWDMER